MAGPGGVFQFPLEVITAELASAPDDATAEDAWVPPEEAALEDEGTPDDATPAADALSAEEAPPAALDATACELPPPPLEAMPDKAMPEEPVPVALLASLVAADVELTVAWLVAALVDAATEEDPVIPELESVPPLEELDVVPPVVGGTGQP